MATKKPVVKKSVSPIPKTRVRKGKFAATSQKSIGRTTVTPYSLSRYKIV